MAKLGEEQTFRSYSEEDAANYAKLRLQYSDDLYQMITSYHTSTEDSKLGTVVDVGCGPGVASFQLAEYFETVIGVDPSEGMINTARSRLAASGGEKDAKNVRFELSTAEDIDPALIPDASVDVITAATCAHVSSMSRVWRYPIYISYFPRASLPTFVHTNIPVVRHDTLLADRGPHPPARRHRRHLGRPARHGALVRPQRRQDQRGVGGDEEKGPRAVRQPRHHDRAQPLPGPRAPLDRGAPRARLRPGHLPQEAVRHRRRPRHALFRGGIFVGL